MKFVVVLVFIFTFLLAYGGTSSPDRVMRCREGGDDFRRLNSENYAELYISRVRLAQLRLRELGYYEGEATGYFDTNTKAALEAFQRDSDLAADGVIGANTLRALGLSPRDRNGGAGAAVFLALIPLPDF